MKQGFFGVLWILGAAACGGQVDPSSGSGAGGGQGVGGASGGDYKQLAPCTLGFDPQRLPDRDCNWLAQGLCYDTLDEACSCACPTDHPATCVSIADSPIRVICY